MKIKNVKQFILVAAIFTGNVYYSQTKFVFKFPENQSDGQPISASKTVTVSSSVSEVVEFGLDVSNLPADNVITITPPDGIKLTSAKSFTLAHNILTFSKNVVNTSITITESTKANVEVSKASFTIKQVIKDPEDKDAGDKDPGDGTNKDPVIPSVLERIDRDYSNLEETPFGLVSRAGNKKEIHLFFDQFGNSLLSTIPQGIANAQYMVHILYLAPVNHPDQTIYSVKQKSGTFNSGLSINNPGVLNTIAGNTNFQSSNDTKMEIYEKKFLLGTATDDLSFDITATVTDETTKKTAKSVLENYTIKMSPVYHVSMDVGFVQTNLQNPIFTLSQSPTDTFNIVKVDDKSPKGVVTVMATFYTSPIVLLRSLFSKKVPFYKLTGRNFLDDHKFYERFYPAIGVGINTGDKSFNNIFYGMNWEVARGLSVFAGWHYGKVRTFEMPGYEEGITPVTQKEFDYYSRTSWKTSTAFGIKADILVVTNLFSGFGK